MINDYLEEQMLHNFGFTPTNQQAEVLKLLADFILSPLDDSVFVLKGFAGTGKTSLVSALVKTMEQIKQDSTVLIAPTGRAAKVFSHYSERQAYTVHKRIYRQKSIDKDSLFELNYNMKSNLLFICDEASMISNDSYLASSLYGTGRLLDDMIHFIYGGKGCRLILLGDTAQLPPVGDGESPALQEDVLRGYGLDVTTYTLTQVVRHADSSGILWNATHLRQLINDEDIFDLPKIRFAGFPDVYNIPGNELIEALEQCYHHDGEDDTIVITRSNKRAVIYNNGIRNQILWRDSELASGDMLMVAKNNYFWTDTLNQEMIEEARKDGIDIKNAPQTPFDFIANGDTVLVKRVRNEREFYGFRFADCELMFPDYDDYEMEVTVLLDTLQAEAPSLTQEQQDKLFNGVYEDYFDLKTKPEKLKAMKKDPLFNALQIKYAYAITCHKAQGGQWSNVFIDQGYMTEDMLGPDYFRWLYTAITRATKNVYFVNWKEEQTLE
ncbi:MAG: AAA family ATPase [Bacteroidaceae bacterium]|nr:AAA family ATPase [Bacteroidaceae bacterium]